MTPVALLTFNRPELTRRVFERIRAAQPPALLIVNDGPRENRPDDNQKCKLVRSIVDLVDWKCEVLTNFSVKKYG